MGASAAKMSAADAVFSVRCCVACSLLRQHICAPPDFAGHKSALAHNRISAADGANGDANIKRQIALRRQFCSSWQCAAVDGIFNSIGQPCLKRAGMSG